MLALPLETISGALPPGRYQELQRPDGSVAPALTAASRAPAGAPRALRGRGRAGRWRPSSRCRSGRPGGWAAPRLGAAGAAGWPTARLRGWRGDEASLGKLVASLDWHCACYSRVESNHSEWVRIYTLAFCSAKPSPLGLAYAIPTRKSPSSQPNASNATHPNQPAVGLWNTAAGQELIHFLLYHSWSLTFPEAQDFI